MYHVHNSVFLHMGLVAQIGVFLFILENALQSPFLFGVMWRKIATLPVAIFSFNHRAAFAFIISTQKFLIENAQIPSGIFICGNFRILRNHLRDRLGFFTLRDFFSIFHFTKVPPLAILIIFEYSKIEKAKKLTWHAKRGGHFRNCQHFCRS